VKDQDLYRIIERAGGRILEVGGCVRDSLRGVTPKDHDYLVCRLDPEQIIRALRGSGRVDVVGQSFGVLKFTPFGTSTTIDLSLPRREVSTGVGHRDFKIDADPHLPVEVDLGRRDFTINAIARDCLTGELIDPFHGADDLAAKTLRMVAPKAFEEDPLRVLRGAQFATRLGLRIEPETLAKMRESGPLLKTISPERIAGELVKGLKADKPGDMFRLLRDNELLAHVLPELARLPADELELAIRAVDAIPFPEPDRVPLRLAAVLHRLTPATVEEVLERVRFTSTGENVDNARIVHLLRHRDFDLAPAPAELPRAEWDRRVRHFASRVGPHAAPDVVRLRIATAGAPEWEAFLAHLEDVLRSGVPLTLKDLAVNGKDLIASGIQPGKGMGRLLAKLLEAVLDDPAANTREGLLARAREA
jgi:tRNA nucleotidyltransferase (CCA-adding enzyme)